MFGNFHLASLNIFPLLVPPIEAWSRRVIDSGFSVDQVLPIGCGCVIGFG